MVCDVGMIIGSIMDVWWVLPNFVGYGKSHVWPWEVGLITHISELMGAFGVIL